MSYFKFLVIIISFFFNFHSLSDDKLAIKNLYLSKSDLELFKISLKEGDKAKWARSLNSAKKINNDIAKKIIKWRWLSAQDGLADLETLKRFYLKNNNWPKKIK